MASVLRWFTGPAVTPEPTTSSENNDDGSDTAGEDDEPKAKKGLEGINLEVEEPSDEDDDVAPAFPAINSAQRASSSHLPAVLTDTQRMPPPPLPNLASRSPGITIMAPSAIVNHGSTLAAGRPSLLGVPGSIAPNKPSGSSLLGSKPNDRPLEALSAKKKREKVALKPGFGPLDWADLKASGVDLRGVDTLMRIPPSELKKHNKKHDCWSAFGGKVYNVTEYLEYHPGGVKELLRVAGRDGTKLFADTHAWVNVDVMMDGCLVGFLVSEPS